MLPPHLRQPMPPSGAVDVAAQSVRPPVQQPTGIQSLPTTLMGYVNPNIQAMPHTGMPAKKPIEETEGEQNYEALPDEIKEKVEQLQKIADKKGKKKEPIKMNLGGDSSFGDFTYDAIKEAFDRSPKMTTINLLGLGSEGANILNQLLGIIPFKKGGYAKKQRKRKHYRASGFVKMKKSKKRKYV